MPNPERPSLKELVDFADLMARVEDDQELLEELFALFREGYPEQRQLLEAALQQGDWPRVAKLAHLLKGMLANLSFSQGVRLAVAMEASARETDAVATRQTLAEFDREVAALMAALDAPQAIA
jgi:HPt (histidine-containing phosphotransfer) domain-containing protein